MHNFQHHLPFSLTAICAISVAVLAIIYIGLIAVIMSYATLTVEFSQSVRNEEADVAKLESKYLSTVSGITNINYAEIGYTKPIAEIFVPSESDTAVR